MSAKLEICAFNLQSCIIAEQAGAARVELCDNPLEGGTTASYGTIKLARENISIALFPIIRPRSMNYFYDSSEINIIRQDIIMCKQLGCDGISIGAQKQDGTLDKDLMSWFAEWAYPMSLTCHRVFDAVPDVFEALETLIDCGYERVLTSGQASTALQGKEVLRKLVLVADNRIGIMPGAGVRASNIVDIAETTHAFEFHTSARVEAPNPVLYQNNQVTDAGQLFLADKTEIVNMLEALCRMPTS